MLVWIRMDFVQMFFQPNSSHRPKCTQVTFELPFWIVGFLSLCLFLLIVGKEPFREFTVTLGNTETLNNKHVMSQCPFYF